MRHLAFSLAAWFVVGSCHIEDDTLVLNQPRPLAATIEAAHQRMHARFAAARRIEQAIAFSDVERARSEAHELVALDEPDVLLTWRPYFDAIRDAAHQLELTGSVMGAARLAATLGRRCASCHEAIAARVTFPAEPRPPEAPRLAGQMLGHQWAAAEMWNGLIGPSDERWLAGARALTTVPLTIVAQSVTPTSELDVDDVARIRLYANRAVAATRQDARAELFGTLLATCAHCHAVLRDR
jgi:cytochrome c553